MLFCKGVLRKSLEEDAKNAALHEKSLLEEIKSLKSQLAVKEKERVETVDIEKMKDVAQEPATPAEALETIPGGVDPEAYKRCIEYCQAQGVNLDTFKFVGIGLDRLHIMPKKSELKLLKYIDDAFVVPDAEAQLAGKSSLELADASVTMIYKVCMFFV